MIIIIDGVNTIFTYISLDVTCDVFIVVDAAAVVDVDDTAFLCFVMTI